MRSMRGCGLPSSSCSSGRSGFPRLSAGGDGQFKTAAAVLYAGLGALVAIWLWRGEWMDAYDALLWLAALVVIELNILRALGRSGRVSG